MAVIQTPKKKGRWYVYHTAYDPKTKKRSRVYLKDDHGKVCSYETKKEARDADAAWRLGRKKRPVRTDKAPLFSSVADSWFEIHGGKVSESTRTRYKIHVGQLKEEFGESRVDQITTQEIETYLAEFAKTHAPRTVNKNLEKLKAIFEAAMEWGYIGVSPAGRIKAYKARKAAIKALTPEQVFALVSKASERSRPIILTAYYTGMRIGEVLPLKWKQIDFDNGVIRVGTGKTDAAIRTVPMMDSLRELLQSRERKGEYVFTNDAGRPHLYSNFRLRDWLPAVKDAGLEHIGVHSLRHSFVSYLISIGLDIKTIQEIVGHASPVTTMREYGHLFEGAKRSAIERMEENLRPLATKLLQENEKTPALALVK